jgi:hypothetical protein
MHDVKREFRLIRACRQPRVAGAFSHAVAVAVCCCPALLTLLTAANWPERRSLPGRPHQDLAHGHRIHGPSVVRVLASCFCYFQHKSTTMSMCANYQIWFPCALITRKIKWTANASVYISPTDLGWREEKASVYKRDEPQTNPTQPNTASLSPSWDGEMLEKVFSVFARKIRMST